MYYLCLLRAFFIHSHQNIKLLNVFVQIVKCIFPSCKMYLSCWCIIYVCWEPFSSIQIKIFEEKTPANWIIASKKDKSQITDWIFKIQHNCANMMSNTKQMVGYKQIQHFQGIKCICLQDFNAQFHLPKHLFVFRSKCLNVFFLIRFLFKCLQLLLRLAGSQSFYKWKIQ